MMEVDEHVFTDGGSAGPVGGTTENTHCRLYILDTQLHSLCFAVEPSLASYVSLA